MRNQQSNSKHCISYAPGHNVHWIQARVKGQEPRYDAEVEILSDSALQVRYSNQLEIFHHHNVSAIQDTLSRVVLDYIKFAPTASLLYIQTEEPNGLHKGVFAVHFLTKGALAECVFEIGQDKPIATNDQDNDW
jgi:hypothetical protein